MYNRHNGLIGNVIYGMNGNIIQLPEAVNLNVDGKGGRQHRVNREIKKGHRHR